MRSVAPERPYLHRSPPVTPAGVLLARPAVLATLVACSVVLAVLAAYDGGRLLLVVDEPVQRWVEGQRTPGLETFFRVMSRLGSNIVVFGLLVPLLVLLGRRCRSLAVALAFSVLARSPIEYVIKVLIDRDRPDLERLVPGTGPSHPSGHVLAAIALWGLLPPIVAMVTDRRLWWWLSVVSGGLLVLLIAASRTYLGVHWMTDLVQGALLGAFYLTAVEVIFERHHRSHRCAASAGSAGGS